MPVCAPTGSGFSYRRCLVRSTAQTGCPNRLAAALLPGRRGTIQVIAHRVSESLPLCIAGLTERDAIRIDAGPGEPRPAVVPYGSVTS